MSLCQNRKRGSCGACCGVYNFDLKKNEIHEIILKRTLSFRENVEYLKRETVIDFREKFEREEENIPRKDSSTYICPFLGFINKENTIGCMIHPILTGDPKSQNYSFYGASICQSYDCKNKEFHPWIEETLSDMDLDYYEYSYIASNHKFIESIILFYKSKNISIENDFVLYKEDIQRIIRRNINDNKEHNLTSFELDAVETNIENLISENSHPD